MEPSPLTQQARPEVFQQKVVSLYEDLFKVGAPRPDSRNILIETQDEGDEIEEKSEGFWKELFLLKPDKATLQKTINDLSPEDLLHLQVRYKTQKYVARV